MARGLAAQVPLRLGQPLGAFLKLPGGPGGSGRNRPYNSENAGLFGRVGHSQECMGTVFFLCSLVRGMCLMVSVAFSVYGTTLGACKRLTSLPIGFVVVAGQRGYFRNFGLSHSVT